MAENFNPRPRKEGDIEQMQEAKKALQFQSTPSQRGRLHRRKSGCLLSYFNPRPRKEGDPFRGVRTRRRFEFQSTPSQRGRLSRFLLLFAPILISIHALAKRATFSLSVAVCADINFNPRPRKEGDALFTAPLVVKIRISIHALAKRATKPAFCHYAY